MSRKEPPANRIFAAGPEFSIYVCCVEAPPNHPEWLGKEWLRMDDPKMVVGHNMACPVGQEESLKLALCESAKRIAAQVQKAEGGRWEGRIRDCSNDPRPDRRMTREEMKGLDLHILNGPDGPGRRFLEHMAERPDASKLGALAGKLKSMPPEPPSKAATREMLERLTGKKTIPGLGEGAIKADFENDPEFTEVEDGWEAG